METAGRFRQITTAPVTQSHVGGVHTLRDAAGGLFRGKVLAVTGRGAIVEVEAQQPGIPGHHHLVMLPKTERQTLVGAVIVEDGND